MIFEILIFLSSRLFFKNFIVFLSEIVFNEFRRTKRGNILLT